MIIARQSTARTVTIGPVLDADGVAVTDGVVGDFKISKNGGAPAALNGSATLTHRHTGHYSLALTASDLDTVGQAEIVIDDTVNACPMKEITVIEEVIYDALFAASANAFAGSAGSTTLGSGAITAAVIATGAIDADAIADNAIDAGALAADCITAAKIANGAIDAATFAADVDAEILSYLVDDATRIDASALNTASGAIGSNGSGLTEAGGTGDHLTAVPWNASWDAEVQSEVDDALVAQKLDHLVAVADADDVADNSIIAKLASKGATADWSTFVNTTDSLEAIRDRGDTAWTTATGFSTHSAADVWSVATRVLTAGTNIVLAKGTGVTGFNDLSAAQVNTEVDTALTDIGLDHLLAASVTGTDVTDNSIVAKLVSKSATADWDSYTNTTDSLEALRDRGDAAWVTATGFSTHTAADVWAAGTRTLTAGTNIVLAKGTGVTGFTDIDAAGVRTAVGLASANLDTQLADLPTVAEFEARTLVAADYFDPATDTVANVTSVGTVTTLTNLPAITSNWLTAAGVASDAANEIADAVLSRNVSNVEASAAEHTLCTIVLASLESSRSGTTWTVKRTDGSTTHATKTLTVDANANPVTSVS